MERVFLYILYFTLVLAGLLLFKALFRNRLSARVQLWLWVALFLYLLIPVMPESPASVYNLLPGEAPAFSVAEPTFSSGILAETEPVLTPPMAVDHRDMIQGWIDESMPYLLLGGVWLMGALVLLGYFAAVYWHELQKTRRLPPVTDPETLLVFERVCSRLGIRRRVQLLSGGDTPMLIGMLRPRILLPDGYTRAEQETVLTHELCHLRHGDLLLLWAALFLLILNWYNPLAWVGHRVFRREVEAYCDHRVVTLLENKKEYANLLLRTALRKNRFVAGTTALQNGEKEVSRRIRYLAHFKKPGVWGAIAILLVGVVLGILLLTNADRAVPSEENNNVIYDPYGSEEYQRIMTELAQTGANIITNASMGWTFSVDSAYEFSEVQYLADYATGGEVDLHDALTQMGVNPSDYYGKAVYVRVDVVESEDGSGIPHFALILPETGEVLAHQLLTAEQEEQLKWICIYAEKLHPKGGAIEPISALYTLTKYELNNHFRITNELGYVYRSLYIRDWVEAGSWTREGGSERRASFTLELRYEKEADNADAPLTMEYEMSVRCNGQTVQLLRKYGDDWYPLDLEQFYPVRTILAQSAMMPN